MTGAVREAEDGGRSVIHFGAPMKAAEVRIEPTWRALGMRGTGSNDVVIENLFVPDASVAFSRKAGEWHPVFHIIATIAFPLIYAVYLGFAESARDIAIDIAKRKPQPDLSLAGRMDTELRAAQLAHRWMLDTVARNAPSADTVNEVMIGRTLVARHAIAAVELAMELAGGASFYRATGLERRFRDIQGARFHPLQSGPQAHYAGATALGLPTSQYFDQSPGRAPPTSRIVGQCDIIRSEMPCENPERNDSMTSWISIHQKQTCGRGDRAACWPQPDTRGERKLKNFYSKRP